METLRVLVVDDEPGMRLGVERALRRFTVNLPETDETFGFRVEQAGDGTSGLEAIRGGTPDVLLLDYKLPDLTGLDILEQTADLSADMLTVMITAYATLETAVTATKRGAYDFLAKPFTPDELKAVVGKAARHLLLQRRARRLAEEKRQVRFQFIRVLAHELKAPLAAVEGYLRIISERTAGDAPETYDRMLGRSLIRLEGMRKLIYDLLDLTAIESGQKQRELTSVDLTESARKAIESFTPAAQERGITVELDAPETMLMTADPGEVDIIFNNLVSNAVKYNRDGGRVAVRLLGEGETVRLEVEDTGIGMTPEDTAKLFEEFVRIKNEKTRNILGSGLGLSILKKLAVSYDGDVSVRSQVDVGTTFTVTLKRDAGEAGKGVG